MKKQVVITLAVGFGLLLPLYNNCGQPRNFPQTEGSKITNDDFYRLNAKGEGPISKLEVTPYELTVYVEQSEGRIVCDWRDLQEQDIDSLKQIGGIQGLLIEISNQQCHLTPRNYQIPIIGNLESPHIEGEVFQVCFIINNSEESCAEFRHEYIIDDERITIAVEGSLQKGDRMFDSQTH